MDKFKIIQLIAQKQWGKLAWRVIRYLGWAAIGAASRLLVEPNL